MIVQNLIGVVATILTIALQLIYMEETENEVRGFLDLWNVKGVNGVRIRQVTFSCNYGKFKNRLDNRPCYWLWSDPHINSDGTVVPCCQDVNGAWPLGNISEKPLGEIWNCDDMIRLRQTHIDGGFRDIPLCKECNMYQPSIPFVIAGAFFNYFTINRLVPMVETQIALRRFSGNDKKVAGARS